MADLIDRQADFVDRQAVLDALKSASTIEMKRRIENLPSVFPERLTDKEQRIFLAAISREEKVCKDVDEKWPTEPYEDSLVRVCREIERKVKKALWTN